MPDPSRRIPILCAALAVAASLAGCGAGARPLVQRHSDVRDTRPPGRGCPGADPCPYSSVSIVGRSGQGVLRFPEALAVAAGGEVYVADQYSYVVQRFTAQGRFLGQWGSHGAGPGQFGAVGGLAVDRAGDVYLVDSEHDRVEEFTPGGAFVRAWGSPGSRVGQFYFGGGAPGAPPGGGIAVAGPYVYVADSGNDRIERFTLQGTHAYAWGARGHGPGQLEYPRGLTVRGDELYVSDTGANRIELFHTDGTYVREAGGLGSAEGRFNSPVSVAVGPAGQVYVADDNNHRVVELTAGLAYVTEWALHPLQDESEGLHANFGSEEVSYPRAVAVSASGLLYVADAAAGEVYVIGPGGGLVGRWGASARSFGQFMLPEDVASAGADVLVADMIGGRVELFDGLAYRTSFDGGAAIVGDHLFEPVAVAVADDGSMWVTDQQNGLVRHLSPEGELLGALGGAGAEPAARLSEPTGVAIAPDGELYVADTGEDLLKRYAPTGQLLGAWGGYGSAPGRFRGPVAVAIAPAGEVYVVDTGDNRIERFTPEGRYLGEWGASGQAPGRFLGPDGIAVDALGDVFVADGGNGRIEQFDADGRFLRMWGKPGGAPGELSGPAGLSIDCHGALLVADADNNRVERFAGVAPPGDCVKASVP